MNVLGIFMEGPNTGACLFRDGRLTAIGEEERFIRVKRAADLFPARAVRYCLEEGGIRLRDVDCIATAWDHDKYPGYMDAFMRRVPERALDCYAESFEGLTHTALSPELARFKIRIAMRKLDPEAACPVRFYPHHLSHAASVHYVSGFEDSAILVLDGSGEEIATSTWHGAAADIAPLDTWYLPDSLGWFYAAITEFLGFAAYSGEGKVMGLAAYGAPAPEIAEKLRRFLVPDAERVYRLDPTFVYYGPRNHSKRFTDKLVELLGPPRQPEAELTEGYVAIAYEAQKLLEEIAAGLARDLLRKTGSRKLCVSGGVAMNCKMNGVLSNLDGVDDVFINPASYDSGAGIGAALLAVRDLGGSPRGNVLEHAYWGPGFADDEIETALRHCGLAYRRSANVAETAADLLARGKIVGWFSGRAEFGARALGARSILANPLLPDIKDRVNARVKYREPFRPFAPSLIEEARDDYMVKAKDSPFMILAYEVKDEFKALFPGVVHVDGTVRPQTVSRRTNRPYWELIKAFGERTGHPIVLNTSFNVRGEPIVNTPLDAIRCYFSTGMDALVLGPFLLEKDGAADGP